MKLNAISRRNLKARAKARIFARLPYCILAAAVYIVPAMFVGMLTAVPLDAGLDRILLMLLINAACEILVLGPIMLGVQYFFVQTARGQTPPANVLFAPLGEARELLRGVRMMLCMLVRMFLLVLVPTILYEAASFFLLRWMDAQGVTDPNVFWGALGALVFLYCLLLLPAAGRAASYWMGYALLHDDPGMGVWRATRAGAKLLRGQRRWMVSFVLSFLPWFLGGFLTCGLLSAFGMVYLCVSLYCLYDHFQAGEEDLGELPQG